MANTNVITALNATNYNGRFDYQGTVGSFNANGQKILQNINGSKEGYGSFEAYRSEEGFEYNPHFSDPTKAADLIATMIAAIEAVQNELNED